MYITYLHPESPKESNNVPWLPHIRELIRMSEAAEIRIATSQISMIEVTSCMEDDALEKSFQSVFNGHHHVRYDVDSRVIEKARQLRSSLLKDDPKIKIAVPDAIHIATAMVLGAGEFHTFDDGKLDENKCSLLKLDGHSLLKGLRIKKPESPQTDLPKLLVASSAQMPLIA